MVLNRLAYPIRWRVVAHQLIANGISHWSAQLDVLERFHHEYPNVNQFLMLLQQRYKNRHQHLLIPVHGIFESRWVSDKKKKGIQLNRIAFLFFLLTILFKIECENKINVMKLVFYRKIKWLIFFSMIVWLFFFINETGSQTSFWPFFVWIMQASVAIRLHLFDLRVKWRRWWWWWWLWWWKFDHHHACLLRRIHTPNRCRTEPVGPLFHFFLSLRANVCSLFLSFFLSVLLQIVYWPFVRCFSGTLFSKLYAD